MKRDGGEGKTKKKRSSSSSHKHKEEQPLAISSASKPSKPTIDVKVTKKSSSSGGPSSSKKSAASSSSSSAFASSSSSSSSSSSKGALAVREALAPAPPIPRRRTPSASTKRPHVAPPASTSQFSVNASLRGGDGVFSVGPFIASLPIPSSSSTPTPVIPIASGYHSDPGSRLRSRRMVQEHQLYNHFEDSQNNNIGFHIERAAISRQGHLSSIPIQQKQSINRYEDDEEEDYDLGSLSKADAFSNGFSMSKGPRKPLPSSQYPPPFSSQLQNQSHHPRSQFSSFDVEAEKAIFRGNNDTFLPSLPSQHHQHYQPQYSLPQVVASSISPSHSNSNNNSSSSSSSSNIGSLSERGTSSRKALRPLAPREYGVSSLPDIVHHTSPSNSSSGLPPWEQPFLSNQHLHPHYVHPSHENGAAHRRQRSLDASGFSSGGEAEVEEEEEGDRDGDGDEVEENEESEEDDDHLVEQARLYLQSAPASSSGISRIVVTDLGASAPLVGFAKKPAGPKKKSDKKNASSSSILSSKKKKDDGHKSRNNGIDGIKPIAMAASASYEQAQLLYNNESRFADLASQFELATSLGDDDELPEYEEEAELELELEDEDEDEEEAEAEDEHDQDQDDDELGEEDELVDDDEEEDEYEKRPILAATKPFHRQSSSSSVFSLVSSSSSSISPFAHSNSFASSSLSSFAFSPSHASFSSSSASFAAVSSHSHAHSSPDSPITPLSPSFQQTTAAQMMEWSAIAAKHGIGFQEFLVRSAKSSASSSAAADVSISPLIGGGGGGGAAAAASSPPSKKSSATKEKKKKSKTKKRKDSKTNGSAPILLPRVVSGEEDLDADAEAATPVHGKKKKKNVSVFSVFPINEKEERERFFRNGFKGNPAFMYSNPTAAAAAAAAFSRPDFRYLRQAMRILQKTLRLFGSESGFLAATQGHILDTSSSIQFFQRYLAAHGLSERVRITLCPNLASATTVRSGGELCIRVPTEYRADRIAGVANHEIGTHVLRRLNEEGQPWHRRRNKWGLKYSLKTEEGLACLNTHVFLGGNHPSSGNAGGGLASKIMFRAALHYYAACKAAEMSFEELFHDLRHYIDDPKKCWTECVRVKRGLQDLSKPGAFCKDQVYLEGAVEILQVRRELDFRLLYAGKLLLQDLPRVSAQGGADLSIVKLPIFMRDREAYLKELDDIEEANDLRGV